jgi:DUF1680 family protein
MSEPLDPSQHIDRRTLLQGSASAVLLLAARHTAAAMQPTIKPAPLNAVALLPSVYLSAVTANRAYLKRLECDRLLHNFRKQAGLAPKGDVYPGWESDTIGGHTLGHYLSALSLMYAQTGDAECKRRADYIVEELVLCQSQSADGFVAGFTRKRGDIVEPGRLVFEEILRGDIRTRSFDLNGCWVPLYSWHKLLAGLLDADRHCGNRDAIVVAERLGGYVAGVFDALDDAQIQHLLDCEHGGLNESFADLHGRTGDPRWLKLSQAIYHRRILEPLSGRQDCLPNIHANTQIPKIIGLARLYDFTGDSRHLTAARFFWETVTRDYSYVIGGNADREYFQAPRSISRHITEQTCESCNSYNMLKLTRYLYKNSPDASYFDYYERTHLNHILAQHHPRTGMFAYMVPLMSGSHREFSTPFDDFWCCVGTGMESHSKHGDSIFWTQGNDVIVNLYIPAVLTLAEPKMGLRLETEYPFADDIALTVTKNASRRASSISLRIPAWCDAPVVTVNGGATALRVTDGYARLHRVWKSGDSIRLVLPRKLRIEPTPDDPATVALMLGPMVMAADLGPATDQWSGPAPVLVGDELLTAMTPTAEPAVFHTHGLARPADLTLRPFAFQYDNNTAVYFRRFSEAGWQQELSRLEALRLRMQELDARSADVVHLGDADAEQVHQLQSKISYAVVYRGRGGRDARSGGFFECEMSTRPGPLLLQATYWGEERDRHFNILIDGALLASERLDGSGPSDFFERDYAIPEALIQGKSRIRVRFEPQSGFTAGPAFGIRIYAKDGARGISLPSANSGG